MMAMLPPGSARARNHRSGDGGLDVAAAAAGGGAPPPFARQVSGFSHILGKQTAYKQVDDNFWEALATCV